MQENIWVEVKGVLLGFSSGPGIHTRSMLVVPDPQVTLHGLSGPQLPQCPSCFVSSADLAGEINQQLLNKQKKNALKSKLY